MKDDDREQDCAAPRVPPGMLDDVAGYRWARNSIGESGAAVYRLHGRAGAQDLFLKHGRGTVAHDITDEMARLLWFASYLPVPKVVQFIRAPGEAWLLMTAVSGQTAHQVLTSQPDARPAIVDALAAFLRHLHAVPIVACPFNADHQLRLAQARTRIDAGLVDADDFDAEREGWTPEQVWRALQDLLPIEPQAVVTHGDLSLDNLLMLNGEVVGCVDVGRAGIADRHQDLAILWNDLGEFGTHLQDRFLLNYGYPEPKLSKLRFHLLLDELF